uniref:(northern house mosquito) hypothetical protein n=1 Tax=Culex pipiens TaxID=7175 RepID=A0A8D8BEC3_CULPI
MSVGGTDDEHLVTAFDPQEPVQAAYKLHNDSSFHVLYIDAVQMALISSMKSTLPVRTPPICVPPSHRKSRDRAWHKVLSIPPTSSKHVSTSLDQTSLKRFDRSDRPPVCLH